MRHESKAQINEQTNCSRPKKNTKTNITKKKSHARKIKKKKKFSIFLYSTFFITNVCYILNEELFPKRIVYFYAPCLFLCNVLTHFY